MSPPPFTPLAGGSDQLVPLFAALDITGVCRRGYGAVCAFGACRIGSGRPFANTAPM